MDQYRIISVLCAVVAVIAVGVMFSSAWADENVAKKALETQGFTNVHITGKHWLFVGVRGCSSDDNVRFDATATNPAGKTVDLFVCTGLFKGATVRS